MKRLTLIVAVLALTSGCAGNRFSIAPAQIAGEQQVASSKSSGAFCPIEVAKDKSMSCDVEVGDRCVQYTRTGSLMFQTNKFGK